MFVRAGVGLVPYWEDRQWAVMNLYGTKTKGVVGGVKTVGLSSENLGRAKKNVDDGIDLYFAPDAPAGTRSNWIPTGRDFFLIFRLYGPDEPLFEKTWMLGDVAKVE